MSSGERDGKSNQLLFGAAGWLFADLLLALAMLFLVANSVAHVTLTPIPTPTMQPPTPTPTPVEIELKPIYVTLTVNPYGVAGNDPGAVQNAQQQVLADPHLAGRRVALVITYGGGAAPTPYGFAVQVAQAVNAYVLKPLTQHNFSNAAYHDPLVQLGTPSYVVLLEIYLFK
jgi:hypothetical protein